MANFTPEKCKQIALARLDVVHKWLEYRKQSKNKLQADYDFVNLLEVYFPNDDIDENSKFSIFLICKNPLCNYDMEVMGKLLKSRDKNLDNVDITKVK